MSTKLTTNTFMKGMNKDLDKAVRPNSTYFDAQNLRVTSSDSGTSGAIETIKGNTKVIDSAVASGQGRILSTQTVIGSCKVRDWLVLFTADYTNSLIPAVIAQSRNQIYAFKVDDNGEIIDDLAQTDALTGQSDPGGTSTTILTADTVGLSNGDTVAIVGTTNYDGLHVISSLVANTSFNIPVDFVSNEGGGGAWIKSGSYINPSVLEGYPACIYDDIGTSTGYLNLTLMNKIKAVGRYESDDVAKVYWTDNYNNLRWVNILDTDVANQSGYRFDVIPDAVLSQASIESLINGNIKAGRIQYTYQLYKSKGSETLFAPMTELISLTLDSENLNSSQFYKGSEQNESTGKGVRISITNSNTGYDFVRGIALHYDALNGTPTIRVFDEQAIDSSGSTFNLNDTGETLGTYEFEEFSTLSRSLFSCKDIESKNDYLFAANITESAFDITDFDTRAYRFDSNGDSLLGDGFSGTYVTNAHTLLGASTTWPSTGTHIATTDGTNWTEYDNQGGTATATGNTYTTATIPETHDCINFFNDYSHDSAASSCPYIYQSNGSTLGASGTNIDITFAVEDVDIDYNVERFEPGDDGDTVPPADATPIYQLTESETDNTSYTGFASPFIGGKYTGYMHDEIYRYGIVFYDGRGRRSYVKWIIDLRMPDHNDYPLTAVSGAASNVTASILVPKFNVKTLPSEASAYQIVRVRRTGFDDRNILAQGLLTASEVTGTTEYPVDVYTGDATIIDAAEYVYLNSPEITFNRNLSYSSGDELVVMSKNYIGHAITSIGVDSPGDPGNAIVVATNDTTGLAEGDFVAIYGTTSFDTVYTEVLAGTLIANTSFEVEGSTGAPETGYWVPYGGIYRNTAAGDEVALVKASAWSGVAIGTTSVDAVDSALIVGPGDSTYNLGGTNTVDVWDETGTRDFFKGTSLLVKYSGSGTWLPADSSTPTSDRTRFLCNYRRNNWLSQYGGNTYEDRSRNTYIAADDIRFSTTNANCYGGDTYITYFNYVNLVGDLTKALANYRMEGVFFPVETTINCDLRHDISDINKLLPADTTAKKLKLQMTQEFGATHEDATGTPNEYEQESNLYLYNTVYSQENSGVLHVATPVDALYSISDTFDTRVKYSDRKVDGEISDSWFKFRTNNFTDIEKEHGEVNNLEVYKDNLLFWQDNGFGALAVNPREVLSTESGTGLVLGTGSILSHIDYISRDVGNKNRFGIAIGDRSAYWLDNERKEVYQFTSGSRGSYNLQSKNDPLSTAKGMSSYLKNNSVIVDVQAIFDRRNNEVLFTMTPGRKGVLDLYTVDITCSTTNLAENQFVIVDGRYYKIVDKTDTTIQAYGVPAYAVDTNNTDLYFGAEPDAVTFSFNETINAFGSFYSFTPAMYIDFKNNFYSIEDHSTPKVYLHDAGNYCVFYDNTASNSSITVTFNPEYTYTKVFDNLIWYNDVIDESGSNPINRFSDTFSTIQIYNDYQNSDELDLAYKTKSGSTDVVYDRRERGFSLALPRNAVDANVSLNPDIFAAGNIDQTQLFKGRIRGKYAVLKLTYDNASNYRLVCPYLTCAYRQSIR